MDSLSACNSPVDGIFNEFKFGYYAKVSLPKGVTPVHNGLDSPLRATAPAFAPETTTAPELPPGLTPMKVPFTDRDTADGSYKAVGDYITRIGKAKEFVPNMASHGDDVINGSHDQTISTTSTSPALSVATTAKSSEVSTTPLTWKDEQDLEDLIGRAVTNELINRFDPASNLTPRALLKTAPITISRNRYLLHELIERVWGGRLIHETARKDNCMHIWVPGSKIPKWLDDIHQKRQAKDRKKASDGKLAPVKVAPVAQPKVSPVKAERPVHSVWANFITDENIRYSKLAAMTSEECAAAKREQAAQQDVKKAEDAEPKTAFKQTFKQTGGDGKGSSSSWGRKYVNVELTDTNGNVTAITTADAPTTTAEETAAAMPKKVTVPPHMRALPPHLRAKSSDAGEKIDEKKTEANEDDTWVAAKLPMACSSD